MVEKYVQFLDSVHQNFTFLATCDVDCCMKITRWTKKGKSGLLRFLLQKNQCLFLPIDGVGFHAFAKFFFLMHWEIYSINASKYFMTVRYDT